MGIEEFEKKVDKKLANWPVVREALSDKIDNQNRISLTRLLTFAGFLVAVLIAFAAVFVCVVFVCISKKIPTEFGYLVIGLVSLFLTGSTTTNAFGAAKDAKVKVAQTTAQQTQQTAIVQNATQGLTEAQKQLAAAPPVTPPDPPNPDKPTPS